MTRSLAVILVVTLLGACGGDEAPSPSPASTAAGAASAGEVVTPPFAVRGNGDGLMMVWFDEEGPHTALGRSEVPEGRRAEVRVDSLDLDDAENRDPEAVFVADLRAPDEDGDYTVRTMPRADFDARIDAFVAAARGEGGSAAVAAAGAGDVIIYGASWCGACRETEAFLRARGVAFVERDVEEDPTAAADMRRSAAAAGLHPTGIPVIDFRGRIILGFDRDALEEAIRETAAPAGGGGVTI